MESHKFTINFYYSNTTFKRKCIYGIWEYIVGWNAKWHRYFGTQLDSVLHLSVHPSYDTAMSLLILYSWDMETYVHTKSYTKMCRAASQKSTLKWKEQKYLSTGTWIKKWSTSIDWNTMQQYKRNNDLIIH